MNPAGRTCYQPIKDGPEGSRARATRADTGFRLPLDQFKQHWLDRPKDVLDAIRDVVGQTRALR